MSLPLLHTLKKTPPKWRLIQRENFTSTAKLAAFLELDPEKKLMLLDHPRFSLNVPKRLALKMGKNNIHDPLLRQFVPLVEELVKAPGFQKDPVQDISFRQEKKILHKYEGRALLLPTGACAMNCRYCFRQNFPYETEEKSYERELAYIKTRTELSEIILSGGDPLSLSDDSLRQILESLEQIPHIKRIRFHTRFPIGIPERIDNSFLEILSNFTKQIFFIIHCNHAKELDMDVGIAITNLKKLGISVLNQSVLLKGVNDDEKTFFDLCQTLVDYGVIPYYLHLLDPVENASHFHVSDQRGKELIKYVQSRLSGFGVPRLVRESPGLQSKTFVY